MEGDIAVNHEWIEYHVRRWDVCLPLVAIATPAAYVRNPLTVFELDFEQNLRIVHRVPKIERAWQILGRARHVDIDDAVRRMIAAHVASDAPEAPRTEESRLDG